MREWQIVTAVVVVAAGWLTWCLDKTGNSILKRLDELEEKIESTQIQSGY